MQTDRELDRIIDDSLPGYSEAEPSAGLEKRVLANALDQQPRRKRNLWIWAFAIPAMASVLALLWMTRPQPLAPQISQPKVEVTRHAPIPRPAPETVRQIPLGKRSQSSRPHPTAPEIAATAQLPKQDTFPTPTPITPEEERMLTFTNSPVRTSAQSDDVAEIPPLHIAELNIEPLTIAETQTTTLENDLPQKNQP